MSWDMPDVRTPKETAWGSASPILVLGIIVFVVPFFNGIGGISIPRWISWAGGVLLMFGIIHSIILASGK